MTTNCKSKLTFEELWEIKNKIISYRDFFLNKRKKMLLTFDGLDINEIVDKFNFQTLKEQYPHFCSLFEKDKSCHSDMGAELNCYGCICPNYIVEISFNAEESLYKIGQCKIDSKFGFYKLTQLKQGEPKSYYILNCINCNVPHNKTFAKKLIEKDLSSKQEKVFTSCHHEEGSKIPTW